MCGRFTLTTTAEILADLFHLLDPPVVEPRYNIAPTQKVLAVRVDPERGDLIPVFMRWGLIPSWSSGPSGPPLINARSETVAEKPVFRNALRQRRCLVPADGFYEWQNRRGVKQPFCFRIRDHRPFAFAALWERWCAPEGGRVDSCAILTTSANDLVQPVHDRMPVILRPGSFASWLAPQPNDCDRLQAMLRPFSSEEMIAYAVSTWVSNPRHDDSRCLAALV
jgi:putative SOS response-associated peptidase YedK